MNSKVTYVGWRITERCNLQCPFCFSNHIKNIYQEMSLAEFEKGLKVLHTAKVRAIGVMGGEPLIYPKIKEVINLIKSYGFEVILSTNGILLEKFMPDLADKLDWLSLSLDGDNAEANDRIRKKGHFDLTTHLISKYKPNKFPYRLKVNTVIHKENLEAIKGIGYLLRGKRAVWKLLHFTPRGLGKRNKERFWVSLTQFRAIAENLRKTLPGLKIVTREYTDAGDLDTFLIRPNGDLLITYKERPERGVLKNYEEGYLKIGNIFDPDALEKIQNIPEYVPQFYSENWREFKESYI